LRREYQGQNRDEDGAAIRSRSHSNDMSGTLSGSLEIDYRILVHGPCEVPPAPGKHDGEWIAYGRFNVEADGLARSGTLT